MKFEGRKKRLSSKLYDALLCGSARESHEVEGCVIFDSPKPKVKANVSIQLVLETEIANRIDGSVTTHLNNKLDSVGQNIRSIFGVHFSQIDA